MSRHKVVTNRYSAGPIMRDALSIKRVAATLSSLAIVEWFLFELLRTPYRPPQDMTTFLGTEKYGVIAFMVILAVLGFVLLYRWFVRSTWTRREVAILAILATVFITLGSIAILAPRWPVTPFHLILK